MNNNLSTVQEEEIKRILFDAICEPTFLKKFGMDGYFEKVDNVTILNSEYLSTVPFSGSGKLSKKHIITQDILTEYKKFNGHFNLTDLSKEVFEIIDFSIN